MITLVLTIMFRMKIQNILLSLWILAGISLFVFYLNKDVLIYEKELNYIDMDTFKREKIKEAFLHAYINYKNRCIQHEEINPNGHPLECYDWLLNKKHANMILPLTLIDSLDTMIIMNLTDEFKWADQYLKENLVFNGDTFEGASIFEIIIRYLGSFLSVYTLTQDKFYLNKSIELVDVLSNSFHTPTGIPLTPYHKINSNEQKSIALAELGSFQLEFMYLYQLTSNVIYYSMAIKPLLSMLENTGFDSLINEDINLESAIPIKTVKISMGGKSDSFYEYLLKTWIMTGNNLFGKWYYSLINKMIDTMTYNFTYANETITVFTELLDGNKIISWDHLSCFSSGMLSLSANSFKLYRNKLNINEQMTYDKHIKLAQDIGLFCKLMHEMPNRVGYISGLPAENVKIDNGEIRVDRSSVYLQRPEAVESWFYLWRFTKNKKYKQWAWELFDAIEKNTKRKYGYTGLHNFQNPKSDNNIQQSFFLAETLKYMYLIFTSDEMLPLDKYVFNTEAHPFAIQYN